MECLIAVGLCIGLVVSVLIYDWIATQRRRRQFAKDCGLWKHLYPED